MWLIPYAKAIIQTDITAEEAGTRLSRLIERAACNPFRTALPGSFVGRVTPSGFRAMRTPSGRDSYNPWILGKLVSLDQGCEVRLTFVVHPVVALIMIVLSAIVLWIAGTYSFWAILAAALLLVAFHVFLYELGFRSGKLDAESDLRAVLRAEPHA